MPRARKRTPLAARESRAQHAALVAEVIFVIDGRRGPARSSTR
jgi:hypothetical protein